MGNEARVARDRKELGAETLISPLQTVLTLTKRAENVERLVIW